MLRGPLASAGVDNWSIRVTEPGTCTVVVPLSLSFFKKYLFIWLCRVLVAAGRLLSCGTWAL